MKSKKILVVDDEENTRKLIKIALTREGYEIEEASSGLEALKILSDMTPLLIILDIVMPDMDGFTLLRQIKNIPVMRNIPVLVSSGKGGMKKYFDLEGERSRPDAFLTKPYKIKDLVDTVEKII